MAYEIIVSGHLCLDLLPGMANVPLAAIASPGKLFETEALSISTGGAVSNTGLALQRLGAKVGLMATVGDDLIGEMIISFLESRQRGLSGLVKKLPGQSSSYTVVLSPENQDRIFLHCTGTNATFNADAIDFELVKDAKIFHLGYPPILPNLIANEGAGLIEIYRRAKQTGVVLSLDMALPAPNSPAGRANWHVILKNTLPYVDIFVPSIEEILFMLRREEYDAWDGRVLSHIARSYLRELAAELLEAGCAIVGFKLSEMGMYLRTSDDLKRLARLDRLAIDYEAWTDVEHYHPSFAVEVAGTTGAGDAAYAGFLAALLRGMGPQDALRWACAVGACNVEAADATSGILSWEDTQARLEAGWATAPKILPD